MRERFVDNTKVFGLTTVRTDVFPDVGRLGAENTKSSSGDMLNVRCLSDT